MNVLSPTWVARFMAEATMKAGWSKDPNTRVGAVIVTVEGKPLSWGFNGIPAGVVDLPERMSRENREKDLWMAHAEENAIANAAAEGVALKGSTAFVTHMPCPRCAGMMIGARIACVVVGEGEWSGSEERNINATLAKFREAGVSVFNADYLISKGK